MPAAYHCQYISHHHAMLHGDDWEFDAAPRMTLLLALSGCGLFAVPCSCLVIFRVMIAVIQCPLLYLWLGLHLYTSLVL
jgi:hypothetical protein